MATADRIYQRTEAGQKAWESRDPDVPAEQCRILGLINGETHSDLLQKRLGHYPSGQISGWLDQLEKRGLLQSVPGAVEHNLDFTGNFTASELMGEEKKPPL
jgi:DNA-binding MarR family transcriptional regulator